MTLRKSYICQPFLIPDQLRLPDSAMKSVEVVTAFDAQYLALRQQSSRWEPLANLTGPRGNLLAHDADRDTQVQGRSHEHPQKTCARLRQCL